ncbi:MAG: efflux RND transporter periplasmic adaptor subunit [Verrucomicrobiota bacterium]
MTTTPHAFGDHTAKTATPAPPPKPARKSGGSWLGVILLVLLAAALGVGIYYGILSRQQAAGALVQETRAAAVPFVSVVHPTRGAASTEIALPGNTQAFISTPIFARTSGYLKSWNADIGAHVKQGQLLAEIETPELDQQLEQAQSDLKNAQANLQISQSTNGRYQGLVASNAVSHEEADTAAADLRSKQALVDSGQANVRRLEQLQAYEKVYAPFDGVITARNTDIGALIQTSDTRELFHLAAIDKLRIYVSVPEIYAAMVTDGEKVSLTIDSFPGETFQGTVVRNSTSIDPVSRTLNVEVDVENPTGKLLPGAYVFVHFKFASTAGSVTVPANTLLFRSEGPRVGVVRDGHARLTPITIGHDYGTSLEVLSGLATDDSVIVDPADSLTDGQAVQVAPPVPAPAGTATAKAP